MTVRNHVSAVREDSRQQYIHTMDLRELLEAIVASPDDDAPRRVYADALLEAGEPQGELIHIQCDLAAGGQTRAEAIARRRRERELLQTHGARWSAGLRSPVFRRGFVDEVVVDPEAFADFGDKLFAAAPALRGVAMEGLSGKAADGSEQAETARILARWQTAITCPAFRRLRGLRFGGFGYECRVFGEVTPGWESLDDEALVAVLATDPSHLECLDARYTDWTGQKLLFASDLVKKLTRLAICPPGSGAARLLFDALEGSSVRSLTLVGNYLDGLEHPVLATLSELRVEALDLELRFSTGKLERFAFSNETIRPIHVDAVNASVRNVRELHLDGDTVPGYRRLERADLLHLRVLRVHGSDIGYDQAVEILKMPCAAQLEVLQLKSIGDADQAKLEQRFGVVVEVRDGGRFRRSVYWS